MLADTVVIENVDELVDAVRQLSAADVITAAAAAASALLAAALVYVTRQYTRSTRVIAQANREMADANQRLLDEMREDRAHFHFQRSVDAATDLVAELAEVMTTWGQSESLAAVGDPYPYQRLMKSWMRTDAVHRGALQPEVLREDVWRFGRILALAVFDWETLLARVEDTDGPRAREQRENGDNRGARIRWVATRLVGSLSRHRRGERVAEHVVPGDPWQFWLAPPGADLEELVEP